MINTPLPMLYSLKPTSRWWVIVFSIRRGDAEGRGTTKKALELDEGLAEAHSAAANNRFDAWDWAGAEQEFNRSIELSPSDGERRTDLVGSMSSVCWRCKYGDSCMSRALVLVVLKALDALAPLVGPMGLILSDPTLVHSRSREQCSWLTSLLSGIIYQLESVRVCERRLKELRRLGISRDCSKHLALAKRVI
jgi:hypothetical protein